ncbi:MAG: BrnT family toxin [Cyanobacteriota bacterium]|jgi:uncharacterized DUF497 family protein
MNPKIDGFDWDEGNEQKCQKHGLAKGDIEAFFKGEVWVAPDIKHSFQEERFIAVGSSASGKPMFVFFTLRIQDDIVQLCPVGTRYMHKNKVRKYEQAFTRNE